MSDGSNQALSTLGILNKEMSTRVYKLPRKGTAKFERLETRYDSVGNITLGLLGASKKAKLKFGERFATLSNLTSTR